ncbi:MAG: hypothetical protein SCH39_01065 [Methanosarcinales archaeon]|nr:hypothetical protein [Methanosarcinales archaeon]
MLNNDLPLPVSSITRPPLSLFHSPAPPLMYQPGARTGKCGLGVVYAHEVH